MVVNVLPSINVNAAESSKFVSSLQTLPVENDLEQFNSILQNSPMFPGSVNQPCVCGLFYFVAYLLRISKANKRKASFDESKSNVAKISRTEYSESSETPVAMSESDCIGLLPLNLTGSHPSVLPYGVSSLFLGLIPTIIIFLISLSLKFMN
jgi:hypothetical protein